jgi:hypothetical protein
LLFFFFLSFIIPGVALGLTSPQAMPTDCLTTYRSIITYISALPPSSLSHIFYILSSIVWFIVFVCLPSNRSFSLSPSLCASVVLVVIVRYVHPLRGLDWTGLSLYVMLLLVVSCYKPSRLLKLLPICSFPLLYLLFLHILSIHMYVAPLSVFLCQE